MGTKVILAGVLAGVGMFVWSSVAHMALPLGEAGVKRVPTEKPLLSSMQAALGDSGGFYIFPSEGMDSHDMATVEKVMAAAPSGILIYHPPGTPLAFGRRISMQLVIQILEALLAAFLLSQAPIRSYSGRVLFVTVAGILASCSTNLEYWNWYGTPAVYVAGYMSTQIVGFLIAGLITARFIRPAESARAAAT